MLVEGADAVRGGLQRVHDARADTLDSGVDLRLGDLQLANLGAIEGARVSPQSRVARGANVFQNAADDVLSAQVFAERGADARAHGRG